MKSTKCLMLQTKDNKKFFTGKKNLPKLKEFISLFGIEIFEVKAADIELLEINELAEAFCTGNFAKKPIYELCKKENPSSDRTRDFLLKNAENTRDYIKDELLKGNEISITNIAEYSNHLGNAYVHLASVVKKLAANEETVVKIRPGVYKLSVKE